MNPSPGRSARLPRRDWILLPLVVIATAGLLAGASELVASLMFTERVTSNCGTGDGTGLWRHKPNCVAWMKNAEGPMVEYRFNDCGYRSTASCGSKPAHSLRIVLMGSSITLGLYVPTDQTFASLTERALNRDCDKPVEIQNMGGIGPIAEQPQLVREALSLSPDAIVLTVAPYDIEGLGAPEPAAGSPPPPTGFHSIIHQITARLMSTRTAFAGAHFMLQDEQFMYRYYLASGTSRNVLSSPLTPEGSRAYAVLESIVRDISVQLRGTGVPLVLMAAPNRVAAGLVSNHAKIDGTDPWQFGRQVTSIAERCQAIGVDATPEFEATPHAERFFYPADSHPDANAHRLLAYALVARLTDGSIPRLASCRLPGEDRR